MTQYKVIYFGLKGRIQAVRFLLEDNGIEYQYDSIAGAEDWTKIKSNMIFRQVPCLIDGDLELVQSNTILRHLARKHGLCGKDDNEAARIDMVHEARNDLFNKFVRMLYAGDKHEEEKVNYLKNLPDDLKLFEELLAKNNGGTGFFIENKISYVDYSMLDLLDDQVQYVPGCLEAFPLLQSYYTRLTSRPKLKAFMERDDIKSMAVTGSGRF